MTSNPLEVGTAAPDDWSIRDRVLDGLVASIRERGYALTRVGDIVRGASTSRRTLYEIFPTKDDCVAALLDRISDQLCGHISAGIDSTAPWAHQVRQAVTGLIEFLAADPDLSCSWVRDMAVGHSSAANARRRCINRITDILLRVGAPDAINPQDVAPMRRFTAVMLIGGLCELAASVIEDGDDVRAITEVAVQAAVNTLGVPVAIPSAASLSS